MNKVTLFKKTSYAYVFFFLLSILLLISMVLVARQAEAAFLPINSTMAVGSTGSDVTNLQTFLASNTHIYPEGLITGYYGGLTRNAVIRLQGEYGIATVGAVGPITMAKINSLIAAGYGIDIYAPIIYNVSEQKTSTSVTFNWNTTESAKGKVFYSTSPFTLREAESNFTEPTITGGTSLLAINSQNSQSIAVQNLQPNTLYYYIIESIDASGNVSVTSQSTFRTNS